MNTWIWSPWQRCRAVDGQRCQTPGDCGQGFALIFSCSRCYILLNAVLRGSISMYLLIAASHSAHTTVLRVFSGLFLSFPVNFSHFR